MPDLEAGAPAHAWPPTVSDEELGQFTFTNTTYGVSTTGGTYVECGVAFLAPITGRSLLHYGAQLDGSGVTVSVLVTPVVRTGDTIGAGTTVVAAADANAIVMLGENQQRAGASLLVTGLTPGAAYNVRLEHRVGSGTGTAERRNVIAAPAT